jgi:hypothetical protein
MTKPTLQTTTTEYNANPERIQGHIATLRKYLHPDRYVNTPGVHILFDMAVADRMLLVKPFLSEKEYKTIQAATQVLMAWLHLDKLWFHDNIHSLGFTKDPTTHENLVIDLMLEALRFLIYYKAEKNDNPIAYIKWILNIRKALFIKQYQTPEVSLTGFEESLAGTQSAPMTEQELNVEAMAEDAQDAARAMKATEIQTMWDVICANKDEAQRATFATRQLRKLQANKPYSPQGNRAKTIRRMAAAFAMANQYNASLVLVRTYLALATS